ncbi:MULTISPECIES: proline dehydrogenase family protein [Olivibacter]|jgi:proline dehydrogenase|uniref:Proline dehydrogenase family protein n=1 Tax=Olivibacter oleidegradans TaxID=760123 RepID=A0ABV6HHL7_9SPHI|nr:proline dehydrogenase family protein [Olivibacter sp. LS-1]QEL00826.1 proline dehydrogenase [Olivibacter sp. LS-1]
MISPSKEPQSVAASDLTFDNTEIAFRSKSNAELNRAYWLFKIISSNFLTKVGPPVTNFALNIGLPITSLIKKTIFEHFCGGETIEGCEKTIQQLASQHVGTILDYSVEGEESEQAFDHVLAETIRTIERAKKDTNIPFSVFKVTGLGRFDLLAKVNTGEPLTETEAAEFARVKNRVEKICAFAHQAGVAVLVDAEHSWIQDTIDDLARDMMRKYNTEKAIVYNTYQLYRHDILAALKADVYLAQTDNFYVGAKLVRGAYMEIERKRAEERGYPSPIQPNKEAADRDYNEAIHFCLDNLDRIGFMAGTHNEASSYLLATELDKRGIARGDRRVYFAQLLGMSDNLSFNLSAAGYNVAKYMPYGPVKAVMPYLFRRAQENTSVAGQTGRELSLIIKEKNRRKK